MLLRYKRMYFGIATLYRKWIPPRICYYQFVTMFLQKLPFSHQINNQRMCTTKMYTIKCVQAKKNIMTKIKTINGLYIYIYIYICVCVCVYIYMIL